MLTILEIYLFVQIAIVESNTWIIDIILVQLNFQKLFNVYLYYHVRSALDHITDVTADIMMNE